MITTTKSKKSDIAKYFAEKPSQFNLSKLELIEMAKSGKDKPGCRSTLGDRFIRFVSKSSKAYDANFRKKIEEIRPEWLITVFDKAAENKKTLMQMAKNGENKPSHNSKFGIYLRRYTNKNSDCYDENFHKKIQKISPNWLLRKRVVNCFFKKQEIILFAKMGYKRSELSASHESTLMGSVCKSHTSYDENFAKLIKNLSPSWFKK